VAFGDDDTWWSPASLSRAASLLAASPRLAVVTARIMVEPGGRLDPICAEMAASPLSRTPDTPVAPLLSSWAEPQWSAGRRSWLSAVRTPPAHRRRRRAAGADLVEAGWTMVYASDLQIHHHASHLGDPLLRRRRGFRNTLWFTWLRRSWPRGWGEAGSWWPAWPGIERPRPPSSTPFEASRGWRRTDGR
jgi:hypothetical protein